MTTNCDHKIPDTGTVKNGNKITNLILKTEK